VKGLYIMEEREKGRYQEPRNWQWFNKNKNKKCNLVTIWYKGIIFILFFGFWSGCKLQCRRSLMWWEMRMGQWHVALQDGGRWGLKVSASNEITVIKYGQKNRKPFHLLSFIQWEYGYVLIVTWYQLFLVISDSVCVKDKSCHVLLYPKRICYMFFKF